MKKYQEAVGQAQPDKANRERELEKGRREAAFSFGEIMLHFVEESNRIDRAVERKKASEKQLNGLIESIRNDFRSRGMGVEFAIETVDSESNSGDPLEWSQSVSLKIFLL